MYALWQGASTRPCIQASKDGSVLTGIYSTLQGLQPGGFSTGGCVGVQGIRLVTNALAKSVDALQLFCFLLVLVCSLRGERQQLS